jgi:2-polyprenyl-6-methoxyphenol hydroxylase-like FAD-dependent oxidoreductase
LGFGSAVLAAGVGSGAGFAVGFADAVALAALFAESPQPSSPRARQRAEARTLVARSASVRLIGAGA